MAGDFRYGFIGEGNRDAPVTSSYVYAFFFRKPFFGKPLQHGVGGFNGAVARWDNQSVEKLRALKNCSFGCGGSDTIPTR